MSNDRISDQDVERVATAVGRKLVRYGLIALLLYLLLGFLLPITFMYVVRISGA